MQPGPEICGQCCLMCIDHVASNGVCTCDMCGVGPVWCGPRVVWATQADAGVQELSCVEAQWAEHRRGAAGVVHTSMHPCVARLACGRACACDCACACCTAVLKDVLWWWTAGRLLLCGGGCVDQRWCMDQATRGLQADRIRRGVVSVQGGECGAVRGMVCQHSHALSAGLHTPYMCVCVVV